ncbi:uncharacterized protein OCT59_016964 [Rhizophagus irregularis]|uniref:F-box domain-containing protein n=2 Tax=Rhizophagus irregularis TaxID=588596 RepID=A0A015IEW8_RHIIW|nr:hypothetical protein RirG_223130 [Rhizophagus irregularis DAOM 197198w]UZO24669.1 hypothetical protein OCT59_016964 [Rhizophagus irregularis]
MSKLNEDVLFLIFKELKHDKKSLYSCLFVNRTWCEIVVPILWENPGQYHGYNSSMSKLFKSIILHLSEESRDTLGIDNSITETYKRPLFNYIDYWKYLDISFIENLIFGRRIIKNSSTSVIKNEILKLFINKNRNTKFIHLFIQDKYKKYYDYQLHHISGAEHCFSNLESFYCQGDVDQNVMKGLAKICKSIKKFRFEYVSCCADISGIIKLIEVQKRLNDVDFTDDYYNNGLNTNKSFYKSLEESLIRHAETVHYLRMDWKPITRLLSYLPNLLSLEFNITHTKCWDELDYLNDLSLPNLKILKTHRAPSKSLVNLIESTKGHLTEIDITYNDIDNERLIQAIYQNCPNLRYLKISLMNNTNSLISEFENLLINCKLLSELIIEIYDRYINVFSWDKLFIILAKSAPIGLFKFKFHSKRFELEDFKLFFDNWKNRNPILLTIGYNPFSISLKEYHQLVDLFEKYKVKEIIKKFFISCLFEEFEWN